MVYKNIWRWSQNQYFINAFHNNSFKQSINYHSWKYVFTITKSLMITAKNNIYFFTLNRLLITDQQIIR